MFGLNNKEIQSIKSVLKNNNIEKSIIFGSRAKGNYKKGSDIDIAIIGNERKLAYQLNEEGNLPYFFDVINLKKITNKELLAHINRVGKEI
ncbi:MAG: nucleotidyltransferase domain-containing protein [Gammaproteobacteria bacterium]|nr:nucleotidyltransferase domain-containing protein [Gammaproteobacteria bacterium]